MNETACKVYSVLGIILDQFSKASSEILILKLQAKSLHKNIKDHSDFFYGKIKNCQLEAFLWKPSEICVSGSSCYQKIKSKWGILSFQTIGMKYHLKKIDYPCIGNHKYSCAAGYCTLNKQTCGVFDYKNQKLAEAKRARLGIKKCHNDFLILDSN